MASICMSRRGNKYQAGVASSEYSRVGKSFQTKSAAKAWAMKVKVLMEMGTSIHDNGTINTKLALDGGNFLKDSVG